MCVWTKPGSTAQPRASITSSARVIDFRADFSDAPIANQHITAHDGVLSSIVTIVPFLMRIDSVMKESDWQDYGIEGGR